MVRDSWREKVQNPHTLAYGRQAKPRVCVPGYKAPNRISRTASTRKSKTTSQNRPPTISQSRSPALKPGRFWITQIEAIHAWLPLFSDTPRWDDKFQAGWLEPDRLGTVLLGSLLLLWLSANDAVHT